MDLLSSIRKSGSRGGVNFSWDEVSTSQHRENYLGHSLMAPVGRWQKGRDLNWYAKGDDKEDGSGETAEEKRVRDRKEEIRRIKEVEEDALARALGLPVAERRNGEGTGANGISVGEMNKVIKETEEGDDDIDEVGKTLGFGDYVGKVDVKIIATTKEDMKGGLVGRKKDDRLVDRESRKKERRDRRHNRSRSRSHERRRRHRHRSRSRERHRRSRSRENHKYRRHHDEGVEKRTRSRSPETRGRRYRERSRSNDIDRHETRRDDRRARRESDCKPRRDDRNDREARRDFVLRFPTDQYPDAGRERDSDRRR